MVRALIATWAVLALCGCGQTDVDLVVPDDGGADSDSDSDSDSDADTDADADADTDDLLDSVKARIIVGEGSGFPDGPTCLLADFFEGPWPDGEPAGHGALIPNPPIMTPEDDEPPYILTFTQPSLEGPYYLFVTVLFHDDCGADPIQELDWTGRSDNPVLLGPGTGEVDAHDIVLQHPPL